MSRNARNCLNSPFFHVMVQGVNREYIFNSNAEKFIYLKILKEAISKFNVNIISYCIMSNHVHLLVNVDDVSELSAFMHKINTVYALIYNNKNNRVGHLFRDRFKSQQIIDLRQLFCCINYIHNNPVKASMCKKQEDYQFSSYKEYLYKKEIIDEEILNQYLGKNYLKELRELEKENTFDFIDDELDKNSICEKIINEYLEKYKIKREDLKNDKVKIIEIAKKLQNYGISYRIMEEKLGVGREKIRMQIVKSNLNKM